MSDKETTGWQPIENAPRDRVTEIIVWVPSAVPKEGGFWFKAVWGPHDEIEGMAWIDPDHPEDLVAHPTQATHWMHPGTP